MLIELTEHKKHMKEHKKEKKQLQDELMVLQQTIREHQLPVIILFEGWSFSGKGTFISELMIHFDFRHLTMHNITPPTEEELRHPFLWRHWNMLPKKGEMSILDCSWYQDISAYPLLNQTDEDKIEERTKEILQFERTLHDAGYIIIKFFLQINEKTLKNRIDGLEITVQQNGALRKKKRNNIINITIFIKCTKICWNLPIRELRHGMW